MADRAFWTRKDELVFIDFLFDHRAACGDGGLFKMTTYNEAAIEVNKHLEKGKKKTGNVCKTKWQAFRASYRAILSIKNKSGWTWNNTTGANIGPEREHDWVQFLRKVPAAKPFKTRGWSHLDKISEIMPSTVTCTYVYRPSDGTTGIHGTRTSSPDWDALSNKQDSDDESDTGHPIERASSEPAPAVPDPSSDDLLATQDIHSTPLAPRRPTVRKRERAVSETPAAPSKRARASGGAEAIRGLTDSIGRFGDNICKVLAGNPMEKTPQRHTQAIKLAQKETWLSASDRLALVKIMEKEINSADGYLALDADDEEFRKLWIEDKIMQARQN